MTRPVPEHHTTGGATELAQQSAGDVNVGQAHPGELAEARREVRRERELERGLVDHISDFLLELGQGFAFVGRQVRLELAGDEFYCDLLFYHVPLHCNIVIELKAVKFHPSFLGQLGMYQAGVDAMLAGSGDNPTIGLLLCKTKNNLVAEYALRNYSAPLGVAEWTTAITTSLPDELASSLPSIAEIEAELAATGEDQS